MRYFEDVSKSGAGPNGGEVYGYDEQDQQQFIDAATKAGWTDITNQWPPAPTLADVKAVKNGEIDAAYTQAIQKDVSFTTAGGTTKNFQADEASQSVLLKTLTNCQAAGKVPSNFYWRSTDNTNVPFTLADLQGLADSIFQQGWSAFKHRADLKSQIAAASKVSDVEAISW